MPQISPIINGSFAERDLELVPHFEVQDGRERESARVPPKSPIINGSFAERDLQLVPYLNAEWKEAWNSFRCIYRVSKNVNHS